jgi:hypothetical protein
MPRADELEHDDRFKLPEWVGDGIATCRHVTVLNTKVRVYWKKYGEQGMFVVSPQYELGDG